MELFDTDLSELVSKLYCSVSETPDDESHRLFKDTILCAVNIAKVNTKKKAEKRVLVLRESGMYIYQKSWAKSLKDCRCALWFNVSSITVDGSRLTVVCDGQAKAKTIIEEQRVPSITKLIQCHLAGIMTQTQLDEIFEEGSVKAGDSHSKPLRALSRFRARFFGSRTDATLPDSISGTYAASLISKTESIDITDYKLDEDGWLCDGKDWVPEFVDSFQLIPWLVEVKFPLNEDMKHLHWECACELLATTTTIKYFATGEAFERQDFDMFCKKIPFMSPVVKEIGFIQNGQSVRGQQLATLVAAMAKNSMTGLSFTSAVDPGRMKMMQEEMANSSIVNLSISHQTNTASVVRTLVSMTELESLSLTDSDLGIAQFLKMARGMPNIQKLNLSGNWILDAGVTITFPSTLQVLKVDGLPIEHMGGIIRSVLASNTLKVFSMCSATGTDKMTNDVFSFLVSDKKRRENNVLEELYLNRCVVTYSVFAYIHQFTELAVLGLDGALGQPDVISHLTNYLSVSHDFYRGIQSLSICGSFERAVSGDDIIKMFDVLGGHNTLRKLDISHTGLGKETPPVRVQEGSRTVPKVPESAVAPETRVDLLIELLKKNTGIEWLGVNGCWNKDANLIDRFVNGLSGRSTPLNILMPKSDVEQMLQIGSIDNEWVNNLHESLEKLRTTKSADGSAPQRPPASRLKPPVSKALDELQQNYSQDTTKQVKVREQLLQPQADEWNFTVERVPPPDSAALIDSFDRYFAEEVVRTIKG